MFKLRWSPARCRRAVVAMRLCLAGGRDELSIGIPMLQETALRDLAWRRRFVGRAVFRPGSRSRSSGQFRQECQRLRISSALSAVFVFRWRFRRCRRTADAEIPSVAAISVFFWPQQQSVRTSRSRFVSPRHWVTSMIACSACGGRQVAAPLFMMDRFARAGFSGHAAQTPQKPVQLLITAPVVAMSVSQSAFCPARRGRPVLRHATILSTAI